MNSNYPCKNCKILSQTIPNCNSPQWSSSEPSSQSLIPSQPTLCSKHQFDVLHWKYPKLHGFGIVLWMIVEGNFLLSPIPKVVW